MRAKAFTLVELIVTITILAILWTIWFISLISYLSWARDSVRVTDVRSIESVLEYSKLQSGNYPDPDNATNITYSGAVAWRQWTFGIESLRDTKWISKVPTDPLLWNEYTYSLNSYWTEFELGWATENLQAGSYIVNDAMADATTMTSYIVGNYNGIGLKMKNGTDYKVLSIPSIIASDISTTDVVWLLTARSLSYDNSNNCLPHSYNYTDACPTLVNPAKILAYSWSSFVDLAASQSSRVTFAKNIQNAYLTTDIANNSVLSRITNTTILESLPSSEAAQIWDELTEFTFDIPISQNSTEIDTETNELLAVFSGTSAFTSNWNTNTCGTPEIVNVTPTNANDTIRTLISNKVYSLEPGTYTMIGPIIMDDCTAIIGEGEVIIESSIALGTMISATSKTNIIIDNITIDWKNYSGWTHADNLTWIDLESASSTVNNVIIKNHRTYWINIDTSDYTTINSAIISSTIWTGTWDEWYWIYLSNSNNNYLIDIKSYGNDGTNTTSGYWIYLNNSDWNYLNNIAVFNNHRYGLIIWTNSNNNAVNNTAVFNNGYWGIRNQSWSNNLYNNIASYKNYQYEFVANTANNVVHEGFFYWALSDQWLYSVASTQYYGTVKSPWFTGNFAWGTDSSLLTLLWTPSTITALGEWTPLTTDWVITPSTAGWDVNWESVQSVTFDWTETFTYGANLQDQNQPVKYDGTAFIAYWTDGVDFDSSKKITQKFWGVVWGGASWYDIFLIAGQSNTHYWSWWYDGALDAWWVNIKQWGRYSPYNNTVSEITSWLDHWTIDAAKIWFWVSFAKDYIADGRLESGQKVLLIPAGYWNTGFSTNNWNKWDTVYEDAITRVNLAIASNAGSTFEWILWHQWEKDASTTTTKAVYKTAFQGMISDMRADITWASSSTPFVLGWMVPSWIDSHNTAPFTADQIEDAHIETISEVDYTWYADWRTPTALVWDIAWWDEIHYTADSQRTLWERYYTAYESALDND